MPYEEEIAAILARADREDEEDDFDIYAEIDSDEEEDY